MRKHFLLYLLLSIFLQKLSAQVSVTELTLKIDTSSFSLKKNTIKYQNQDYLYIKVDDNRELCQIELVLSDSVDKVLLTAEPFVSIPDSMQRTGKRKWRGMIRFENLIFPQNPVLSFHLIHGGIQTEAKFTILPVFETAVLYQAGITDIYQEEEKIIEVPSKNSFNIITDNLWYVTEDFDYKTSNTSGTTTVTIKPHTLGFNQLSLTLKTIKPIFNSSGQLTNELPPITIRFFVKPNQLYFINTDKNVIYVDPNFKSSEDILISYNRNLSLKKTYRVEDSPEDGNLIAEITPLSIVENNSKILCRIKPYSLHRTSEGYLYITEEGRARFITNFNIWEKPTITSISVRHEGEDWTMNNNVSPGEDLDVRIDGKGLENAKINFSGISDAIQDTLRISDESIFYHIHIPITISSKNIPLILNKKSTPFELNVKEYQKPAQLDFIAVNYGKDNIPLTSDKLNKPIFYEETLNDINLIFNPAKIDENNHLFGKQYLNIQIKIFNSKNDLIEIQNIDNVVVCPGDNSPRKLFYNYKDCNYEPISLNDYLVHKTYKLDPFTQIEISISQNENKYSSKGYSRKIRLIITRKIHFDVQVTFPTGLLVKKLNESGYGNLTGISTSILAQFNFYDPRLIGQLKPYHIGAGFIALNAFNFSSSATNIRDVGIVILGSITPVRREAKFSLPIYAGGGYLLKSNAWFILFGPGIQLNF